MVCTSGNASSHCSFSSMQQQQRQQQAMLFGVERLMTAAYPPVRFEPRPTILLRRKIDVINCITRRVRRISQGLVDGTCSFENRRALAHTIVQSALQAAYPNCRRDIFVASACEGSHGSLLHGDTIAGAFLCDTVTYADPLIYASVLSSFIAYGVDFALPRHSSRGHSAGRNNVTPPLPSLDTALYCLHNAVKEICVTLTVLIGGTVTGYDKENGGIMRKRSPNAFVEAFHALANSYTLLSLLRFFAEEEVVDEGGNAGEGTATADASYRDKPLRYTTALLYRLFDAELESASEEGLSSSSSSSVIPSISSTFASGFKRAIKYYSAAGVKWNLSNQMNLREARNMLFHVSPLVRAMVVLMAYYCRHFPALYQAVVKSVEAPFIMDQLVHSALLHFPMRPHEEMERERSIFCEKKSRSLAGNLRQVAEPEPVNEAWLTALTTPDRAEGGANPEDDTLFPELVEKYRERRLSQRRGSLPGATVMPNNTVLPQSTETRGSPFACVGLLNVGNTCFINSFTQLFFAARHFRMDLLREKIPRLVPLLLNSVNETTGVGSEHGRQRISGHRPIIGPHVTAGFVLLMLQMHWMVTHGHSGGVVDTKYFRDLLPEPFNDGLQHDASEYGKVLMELLDNSSASEALWDAPRVEEEDEDDGRRAYVPHQQEEEYEQETRRNREEQQTLGGRGGGGRFTANFLSAVAHTHAEGNKRTETKHNIHGSGSGVGAGLTTVVARWFGGVSASLIECMACHHTRTQLSPFWDISVPLRREKDDDGPRMYPAEAVSHERRIVDGDAHVLRSEDGHIAITKYCVQDADSDDMLLEQEEAEEEPRQQPSLQELVDSVLNYHDSGELLHGDNMTYCESCRRREPVILRTAVHTTCKRVVPLTEEHVNGARGQLREKDIEGVPFYLTLQLNRFQYLRETGNHEKVMDKVTINKVISVPVRVVVRGSGHTGEEEDIGSEEVVHERIHYRLIAVLVHSGPSPRSGHYFTLLRFFADTENAEEDGDTCDSWVLANDSITSLLNSETSENILSGFGGIFGPSETPYIILYERCGYLPPATDELDLPVAIEQLLRELVKPEAQAPPASANNDTKGNDRGGDGDGGGGNHDGNGSGGNRGGGVDAFGSNNSFWGGGAPIF
uniref:Ubiquitin hydrolase n=1 Tax=Trypanosoma dionisii TaxID=78083 RepID=M4H272_9TRYP|nr:ubiquitin hydrolase [Trypanosoma dionisii]